MFERENADWVSGLHFVKKKWNNTTHSSGKMTPIKLPKNEKIIFANLQHKREKNVLWFKFGQLVRNADIKNVFSEGNSTNYSDTFYTITEVIHGTIPSYRVK